MPPTGVPVNYLNGSSKTVISLRTSLKSRSFDDLSIRRLERGCEALNGK